MMNYAETASRSTTVPVGAIPCSHSQERAGAPSPFSFNQMQAILLEQAEALDAKASDASKQTPDSSATYQEIHVQKMCFVVHPALAQGYQVACQAYHRMEKECEYGPYLFLTGYEYAHLARQQCPAGLAPAEKRQWHGGFIAGWTACMFLLDLDA